MKATGYYISSGMFFVALYAAVTGFTPDPSIPVTYLIKYVFIIIPFAGCIQQLVNGIKAQLK